MKHMCVLFLFFYSSVLSLVSDMAHWTQDPEERNPFPGHNWVRAARCLSRMTQQMGGPPNSKWRDKRMGANGSSYPHSCSPRIGGNAQGQQTFIGMYSKHPVSINFEANIQMIVFFELTVLEPPRSNIQLVPKYPTTLVSLSHCLCHFF